MPFILWDGRELTKELFADCERVPVFVQYNVTPEETRTQNFARIRGITNSIMKIGAPARKSLILSFAGYDFDPRPLDAVPDVVRYIKQIVNDVPNIWYFLIPELNMHMFTCLVPHTVITSPFFPKIKYDSGFPAVEQRLIQLDLPAADKQIKRMTEDVIRFGKSVGDEAGAKKILNEWRVVLEL